MRIHPAIADFRERPRRPAYLALYESGELQRRAELAVAELRTCRVCPRDCEVDRLDAIGPEAAFAERSEGRQVPGKPLKRELAAHIPRGAACFTGRYARVSSWYAHHGEERCLRGARGSGTIFFSFCNLRCVFCQNWDTSQAGVGVEMQPQRLAAAMLDLQQQGCHNINFVTPEHVVPQLLEALVIAVQRGLRLPLIYNTSGYDSMQSLRLMDGVVDIYMPDFKHASAALAKRYLKAEDYPAVALQVIGEMHRQVGVLRFDEAGLATRGVLVRHLVMPGVASDAQDVFTALAAISTDMWVHVMNQYYPTGQASGGRYPEIDRRPTRREVLLARDAAKRAGLWRLEGLT